MFARVHVPDVVLSMSWSRWLEKQVDDFARDSNIYTTKHINPGIRWWNWSSERECFEAGYVENYKASWLHFTLIQTKLEFQGCKSRRKERICVLEEDVNCDNKYPQLPSTAPYHMQQSKVNQTLPFETSPLKLFQNKGCDEANIYAKQMNHIV